MWRDPLFYLLMFATAAFAIFGAGAREGEVVVTIDKVERVRRWRERRKAEQQEAD